MSGHLILHRILKRSSFHYVWSDFIPCLIVIKNINKNNKHERSYLRHQLFFQHEGVFTSSQHIRHGMETLRHTFQLRLVVGRSHYRLCSWCLSCYHKLQLQEQRESQSNCHSILHSFMFLSARSEG
jgi:hypothetical protein